MPSEPKNAATGESPDLAQLQLPQSLAECHAIIAELRVRVKWLEERVKLDSNNSSKPPSSDGPGKPNRSQRRASGRKRGAQPGHTGHSRALVDEAELDSLQDCKPDAVCSCGAQVELDDQARRHQVFEVPEIRARVDEYRVYSGRCLGCGAAAAGGVCHLPVAGEVGEATGQHG